MITKGITRLYCWYTFASAKSYTDFSMILHFFPYSLSKAYQTISWDSLLDPTVVAQEVSISGCFFHSSVSYHFRVLPSDLFTRIDTNLLSAVLQRSSMQLVKEQHLSDGSLNYLVTFPFSIHSHSPTDQCMSWSRAENGGKELEAQTFQLAEMGWEEVWGVVANF